MAIYRPAAGEWWISRSASSAVAFQFGTATDKVVPADYTGDGRADLAIWRPADKNWCLQRSQAGFTAVLFGINGDTPVPSAFTP